MGLSKTSDFPSPEPFFEYESSFLLRTINNSATQLRSKSLSNIAFRVEEQPDVNGLKQRLLRPNSQIPAHRAFFSFTRRQKLTLLSLALVDFMSFCSMSIMAPFFPREAASKGLSDTISGFVFSFFALVMFLTSPIFGKVIPKFGARSLFFSGMLLTGICNVIFGMLEYVENYTLFTVLCIVVRGFEALGASAFCTTSYVFVVNTFPNNIGTVLGILETFIGLGMSTGPALGGLLYSVGGFGTPFYVLGVVMILVVAVNFYLLPAAEDCSINQRSESFWRLLRVPSVIVTGMVVVVAASIWGFLDPTLEPHLRQYELNPGQVGLIFLLFSGLYGISSPAWGWLADRLHSSWSMMVCGLWCNTVCLLILGPCPFLPFLPNSLWLDLVALGLLGVSIALALLPTFQAILSSAMDSGCADSIATYSLVAGVWSCMYSFGEVIGPSLGGFLLQTYGFPITATIMSLFTFVLGCIPFVYALVRKCCNKSNRNCSPSGRISPLWLPRKPSLNLETTPLLYSQSDPFDSRLLTQPNGGIQYYSTSMGAVEV